MYDRRGDLLPGSQECVGCGGMTFRRREDALCPRCAFDAEALIERIELDCLDHDLQLITEFEAYYRRREQDRERYGELARRPVFARRAAPFAAGDREPVAFTPDAFWLELRKAG
jgi:hypothetical protein